MPSFWPLIGLALVWAAWCGLHSLLIQPKVRRALQKALGVRTSTYRLFFSLLALITIAPPAWLTLELGGLRSFAWPGVWLIPQAILWLAALCLMWWASASFSRGGFDLTGLSDTLRGLDRPHNLVTSGVYGHLRHPMNLAGLVMLWSRHLGPADLVTNLVLSTFLLVSIWWEERRLLAMFGQAYRDYQGRAPMLGWRFKV